MHFLCMSTHRRARWRIAVCIALQATLVFRRSPLELLSTLRRCECRRPRLHEPSGISDSDPSNVARGASASHSSHVPINHSLGMVSSSES